MNKSILTLVIVLCIACQNVNKEKTSLTSRQESQKEIAAFQRELDSLYQLGVYNGYSLAVVDSIGIKYNQGYGFADVKNKKEFNANTQINIASISKVFIGIALLKAQEMDLLNLDEPINAYLPFEVVNPSYINEPITIRQLATHTSSIVDTDVYMETDYVNKDDIPLAENLKEKYDLYYQNPSSDWVSLAAYMNKLLAKDGDLYHVSTFANRKPGDVFEYSNTGAALCALVIENAAKQELNLFTKEHIFKPLNMSSTAWFFEEVDMANYSKLYADDQELPYYKILSYPDGGLITSSNDLSLFLLDLIQGFSGNGTLLKPNSYKELFKSQLAEAAFQGKENYNVGLFTEKELAYNVIGHSGGDPGTNTMMYFNTKTKTGKIMILNTDSQKENSKEVFWGIWNVLDKF